MSNLPSWVPSTDQARQVKEGMKVLGTSHPGKAFNPHYIKSSTTVMIPPSCANFGKGVNYMQASVKIAGKLTAALQMANAVFKIGKKLVDYLKKLGVKSYSDDYKTDAMFLSSTPLRLQSRFNTNMCLGIVPPNDARNNNGDENQVVGMIPNCFDKKKSIQGTLWRAEDRQKDDKPEDEKLRLYQVTKTMTTKGEMITNYYVDNGIDGGFGPGKCLVEKNNQLIVSECTDNTKNGATDFTLKSNGMLCFDDCTKCLTIDNSSNNIIIKKCGVPLQKYQIKKLWGGGDYKLTDNLLLFDSIPVNKQSGGGFKDVPTPKEFRKCNWLNDRTTFINNYWPLIARKKLCTSIIGCGYDEMDGWCKSLNWNAEENIDVTKI
jgi:hypothetical protein